MHWIELSKKSLPLKHLLKSMSLTENAPSFHWTLITSQVDIAVIIHHDVVGIAVHNLLLLRIVSLGLLL